ncbi:unnamed protein product [Clonostachys rhizophaga]|uniref:Uncharacterized protein n=1 Tax=Clonostachys rhizophaga TaxID=160324 RepID=A0A9N9VMX6_9HYPO|nr:unnamed protein product [Clonostachys rhizophaga]
MFLPNSSQKFGSLVNAGRIYFRTKKDKTAGVKEDGYIEPGVRFCFYLKLEKDLTPTPNKEEKAIGRFLPLSVKEVIKSIEGGQWKPRSGLVMLASFHKHGCIGNEDLDEKKLYVLPPFDLSGFSEQVNDERRGQRGL